MHALRLALFGSVAAGAVVLWFALRMSGAPLALGIPGRCTIGLAGSAASVTADGVGAQGWCEATAARSAGAGWYVYASGAEPGGAVICQIPKAAMTLTVRDQGILNLEGTQACRDLANQ